MQFQGKKMSDDPRWQIMADLGERATAPDSGGDSGEFARRFEEFLATAEAIAEDQAAAAEDRVVARKILVRIDGAMRANAPALLATLAKMARDPNLAADARTEALRMLTRANEQLRPASDKRH
jgi:hypothetical protein